MEESGQESGTAHEPMRDLQTHVQAYAPGFNQILTLAHHTKDPAVLALLADLYDAIPSGHPDEDIFSNIRPLLERFIKGVKGETDEETLPLANRIAVLGVTLKERIRGVLRHIKQKPGYEDFSFTSTHMDGRLLDTDDIFLPDLNRHDTKRIREIYDATAALTEAIMGELGRQFPEEVAARMTEIKYEYMGHAEKFGISVRELLNYEAWQAFIWGSPGSAMRGDLSGEKSIIRFLRTKLSYLRRHGPENSLPAKLPPRVSSSL